MSAGMEELSKFIFTSKYARYREEDNRRETWDEAVDRVLNMHLEKYEKKLTRDDKKKVRQVFEKVRKDLSIPSMRSMQFGGKAVFAHESRMYNCSVTHIHSIRTFAEIFYLLLCGCGVTIGLRKKYLDRLPDLVGPDDKTGTVITYAVEDTIEGWSDSIEALLLCYFKNTPYSGRKIIFDYSKIRKKGSPLKTGGGKAPGHAGLKQSHQRVKALLDFLIEKKGLERLRSIDAHDIVMHCSDAVLSGGIRRAACASIFEADDMDMILCKTNLPIIKIEKFEKNDKGEYEGFVHDEKGRHEVTLNEYEYGLVKKDKVIPWYKIEPQRARANNSVLIRRDIITKEQFEAIIEQTKQWGEPGFVFSSHDDTLYNPCQPGFAPVLTPEGIRTFDDIDVGSQIWSETGWTTVIKKWSTGIKKVYAYHTSAGVFYGTENHRIISNGTKIEVGSANSIDSLVSNKMINTDNQFITSAVMDGLLIGDGTRHKESANKVMLVAGKEEIELYKNSEIGSYITGQHPAGDYLYSVNSELQYDDVGPLHLRKIPDVYFYGNDLEKMSFLRGLYSANGSVVRDRVTLKTTSFDLARQVQMMLSSLGIKSYYTTNKEKDIAWDNGIYLSKESYDINITTDRDTFAQIIGFIHGSKNNKLNKVIESKVRKGTRKVTHSILKKEYLGEMEVFDITVDNEPHTYWTGGLNVSNCFEVSFIPVTDDGQLGVQFCNLSSVNGAKVKTFEDMLEAVEAATIIGTLQAGYTDFKYLSPVAKQLTESEALLGVSITGMMDSPDILLNPRNQYLAAEYVKKINKEWSAKIGINQAARTTLVKPEGCLKSDTIISTEKGFLKLEELGDLGGEAWQDHSFNTYTTSGKKNSSKFHVNGHASTKRIRFESGIEIEGTLNHKLKVFRDESIDYIPLSEVKHGDQLMYARSYYDGGEPQKLYDKFGSIVTELNTEIAAIIGLRYSMLGHEDMVKYESAEDENILKGISLFRINNLYPDHDADLSSIEIPSAIRKSKIEVIQAFLAGFFSYSRIKKSVVFTESKKLATQIVVLGRAVGFESSFSVVETEDSNKVVYKLQDRNNLENTSVDFEVNDTVMNFALDTVVEITDSECETFDIEVDEVHQYLAFGFVSHNTSSLKLKSASGIHPHHAKRYFRRVQVNKQDPVYKWFKKHNPHACEPSIWSATKTDDVITFPVEAPAGAMVKADLSAIEHLDIIKNTQLNWVNTGTTEANKKPITHNVSCTVIVRDNEWQEVIEYLYKNRDNFSAVSLLPETGDKGYAQAPLEKVLEEDEERWRNLVDNFKPVDYTQLSENEDKTAIMDTVACAGGACEVDFSTN